MEDLNAFLEPGALVRHPDHPEWGVGQVQSNVDAKVTVNFPEVGKIVINSRQILLLST